VVLIKRFLPGLFLLTRFHVSDQVNPKELNHIRQPETVQPKVQMIAIIKNVTELSSDYYSQEYNHSAFHKAIDNHDARDCIVNGHFKNILKKNNSKIPYFMAYIGNDELIAKAENS